MNVWDWPTWFVSSGAIVIFAFTQRFVAGPEFAAVPFACRVRETPPTETVVCAETTVTPVTPDVRLIEQLPVPPAVVHGFGVVNPPGPPPSIVKLI
jgi:hypothetical protein